MKRLFTVLCFALFILASCDTQNTTCPNGQSVMWVDGIHCVLGREFTTPEG